MKYIYLIIWEWEKFEFVYGKFFNVVSYDNDIDVDLLSVWKYILS